MKVDDFNHSYFTIDLYFQSNSSKQNVNKIDNNELHPF